MVLVQGGDTDQRNRTDPEVAAYKHGQLIFDKGTKASALQMEERQSFQQLGLEQLDMQFCLGYPKFGFPNKFPLTP